MTNNSTAPANTLPKRRKVKEMILANSLTNSRIPTNRSITFMPVMFGRKNLRKYEPPSACTPMICVQTTEINAMASGTFRSVAGGRTNGDRT